MLFSRSGAALVGFTLGVAVPSNVVNSDSWTNRTPWISWILREQSIHDAEFQNRDTKLKRLRSSPGRVFAWGGSFGKSPRQIAELGDRIVQVAAADGLGSAIDSEGHVHAFFSEDGTDRVCKLSHDTPARDAAVRDKAAEIVVLDSHGRVLSTRKTPQGTFRPLSLLGGALARAKVRQISCGTNHCIAITNSGEAIAWGESNSHGQLGRRADARGDYENAETPLRVDLPRDVLIRDAACGDRHTLFLDSNDGLHGVGDDQWAQLGISGEPWLRSHEKTSAAVRKSELLTDLAGCGVASGGKHSVMLVKDGTVFSFGFNQWGQLGHHNYSSFAPPSPIADHKIRATTIAAGDNHTCLVNDDGELLCIGANDRGQLGIGNLQPSMVWKKVRLGKKAIKPSYVSVGGHTCAVVIAGPE